MQSVEPDDMALRFIREAAPTPVRIIANRPDTGLPEEYDHKLREASLITSRDSACCSYSGDTKSLRQPCFRSNCGAH